MAKENNNRFPELPPLEDTSSASSFCCKEEDKEEANDSALPAAIQEETREVAWGSTAEDDGDEIESNNMIVDDLDSIGPPSGALQERDESFLVAKRENRWVWRLRLLTAFVLFCVAIVVCLTVYIITRNSEKRDYEEDFVELGAKVDSAFGKVVKQRLGILQGFSSEITAYAANTNQSWPFVTPPSFTYRAPSVAHLAHVLSLEMVPRVETDELEEWNSYAVSNQAWKAEGIATEQGVEPANIDAALIFPYIVKRVRSGGGPILEDGPGPYFPSWLSYPITNTSVVNLNLYADAEHHQAPIDNVFETGRPTFETSTDYIPSISEEEDRDDQQYHDFLKSNSYIDYQDDPIAPVFIPIWDQLAGEDRKVVGMLHSIVYWRDYFEGILPPGAVGIMVILENDCGQQYTYQVDGSIAKFVGVGDLHDPKYEYLGSVGADIKSMMFPSQEDDGGDKEGGHERMKSDSVEDDEEEFPGCNYSIRVFPSQTFEESRYSDNPWIYAVILASLFLITSVVFLLYDCMVERRQTVVLKSARQSGKLVRSLFPDDVRDQLYADQEAKEREERANAAAVAAAAKPQTWDHATISISKQQQLEGSSSMMDYSSSQYDENPHEDKKRAGAMIANLYPETTIFFADLAGFTNWSSTRTPIEVFQLLETLYGAFDAIASRRNVFKVETIGDCYVAVTGLPKPQKDHAEIMVKFAMDCMAKMHFIVTGPLSESLGADTADLAMRVGLHSGPVTAGVLRGQKSRFQLFGDTVNTASRMESNGERGRIQVSQETADALAQAGKMDWTVPRDGTVSIKGKGEMQTYWIDPRNTRSSFVASSTVSTSPTRSSATYTSGSRGVNGSSVFSPSSTNSCRMTFTGMIEDVSPPFS